MKLPKKHPDESSKQTAKMNRERPAPPERREILVQIEKKAADVRSNVARLREQRLAKEAEIVRAEIATGSRPAKTKPSKPRKRFR
jgi:hypothetical protein